MTTPRSAGARRGAAVGRAVRRAVRIFPRSAAPARQPTGVADRSDDPDGRLGDLGQRLERVDHTISALTEEMQARLDAVAEAQATTAADLANVPTILRMLSEQLEAMSSRTSKVEQAQLRLESLERRVVRLQEETDSAGAMAATAVAAADEIEALAPALRELRVELLALADRVQAGLTATGDSSR